MSWMLTEKKKMIHCDFFFLSAVGLYRANAETPKITVRVCKCMQ